jgi:uncharacterized protein involved in response to NO
MSTTPSHLQLSPATLRLLAAAPHRLLFFIGAANVLLAMVWWAVWLVDTRWNVFGLPQPAVPAGWLHAMLMQYHVLPCFIFGFLLTVFPRWMNQEPFRALHYLPVGIGLIAGQLATLAGLSGGWTFLWIGAVCTLLGWSIGTGLLLTRVVHDRGHTWHAVSCAAALCFGWLGLIAYLVFLHTSDPRLVFIAIKVGSITLLLSIFFTVCHRMIPFFAGAALPEYRVVRPLWALGVFWALAIVHVWLELRHAYQWLFVTDAPLAALTAWLLWRWWPRTPHQPALLRVLFIGFAWLPVAFALYVLQSVWFAWTGEFVLGRAPAHALFVGFFGSLVVAMVTRVTQGHSGRPLVLGRVAAFAFVCVQLVAIGRVLSELQSDPMSGFAFTAIGWVVAFLPWVVRSCWIYLTPRVDGKQG